MNGLDYPMNKAREVAKIIVNECIDKGYFLSCYKLEQLLILMKGIYLERYSKSLFSEEIFSADRGLWIPNVEYSAFIQLEGDLKNEEKLPVFIVPLEKENEVINYVLDNYGMLYADDIKEAYAISRLTLKYKGEHHQEKISDEELEEYFVKYGYSNLEDKKEESKKDTISYKDSDKKKVTLKGLLKTKWQ